MFIDVGIEDFDANARYDVCIIGAGAAGIALAMEFASRKERRICLIEGGAFEFDDATQDLYRGEVAGREYADLDASRLRFFGGTTNHWAGYCLTFSDNAFERRPWIGETGWPIGRDDVAPYYERARELLGLPKLGGWDPATGWSMEALEQHYGSPRLEYQFDNFRQNALMVQPVRMGEVFRGALEAANNIDVLLNANAVEIDVDETGEQATGVQIRTLSGRASTVAASNVVVAAGGIENPRLLLSSTKVHQDGIGNANDLVGRYFADHINIEPGMLVPEDPGVDLDLYQRRNINPACETVVWHELTPETQEQHELIPASVRLMSVDDALSGPGATSLKQLKRDLSRGGIPNDLSGHVLTVLGDIEPMAGYVAKHLWYGHAPVSKVNYEMSLAPAPNRESRIYLGDETDALGMRRVVLDWKLSDVDFRTIRWAATSFADQAAANGFGRSKLELSDEYLSENVRYTWHHMCTTRMSASPGDGVVDGDCRIHGMKNLYLAGSSVFTTSGWGSPTFLIVALAQRLADHLERRIAT